MNPVCVRRVDWAVDFFVGIAPRTMVARVHTPTKAIRFELSALSHPTLREGGEAAHQESISWTYYLKAHHSTCDWKTLVDGEEIAGKDGDPNWFRKATQMYGRPYENGRATCRFDMNEAETVIVHSVSIDDGPRWDNPRPGHILGVWALVAAYGSLRHQINRRPFVGLFFHGFGQLSAELDSWGRAVKVCWAPGEPLKNIAAPTFLTQDFMEAGVGRELESPTLWSHTR